MGILSHLQPTKKGCCVLLPTAYSYPHLPYILDSLQSTHYKTATVQWTRQSAQESYVFASIPCFLVKLTQCSCKKGNIRTISNKRHIKPSKFCHLLPGKGLRVCTTPSLQVCQLIPNGSWSFRSCLTFSQLGVSNSTNMITVRSARVKGSDRLKRGSKSDVTASADGAAQHDEMCGDGYRFESIHGNAIVFGWYRQ